MYINIDIIVSMCIYIYVYIYMYTHNHDPAKTNKYHIYIHKIKVVWKRCFIIQSHIQTLCCFLPYRFCEEMVTEEPNLIVSHENNMLQLYYTQWSWNCRGCWHQSCLQLPLTKKLKFYLFQITRHGCTVLLFLTPPCVKINLGNLHACRLPVIYTQFF